MKKNFLTLTIAAGVLTLVAISGCKKTEDTFNCVDAAQDLEEARVAYYADMSNKAKCEAYADEIQKFMNTCPDQAAGYETVLNMTNSSCEGLD